MGKPCNSQVCPTKAGKNRVRRLSSGIQCVHCVANRCTEKNHGMEWTVNAASGTRQTINTIMPKTR